MASTLYQFKADLKGLIELDKKLKKAKASLKGLTKGTEEYKRATAGIKKTSAAFKEQTKSMHDATGAAGKMNKAGGKLMNTFKSAAVAIASAFAVRAIVGAIKGAIAVFAKFEEKMAAVKAISGATDSEFIKLKGSAEKLGKSTVFTAAQVAELQEEYARLGFSSAEIMKVQSATLDLAAATGETLSNSAATAGSVLRAFNLEAEQTQRVTDVMAIAFTNSALNLERFKESMKFVAPVARATGFTLEETSSQLMVLADNGLHGSIAGNALKNIMLKLGDANSKLSKKLGRTVQGLPDLVVAMKELGVETFSATEAVDLLDKRSAPAFLALINNIDGLEESVRLLDAAEGATARMAAIRLDTLQGDMTLLKSAMEGLGIAIGGEFDIGMRNAIYTFTRMIQKMSESEGAMGALRMVTMLVISALIGLSTRLSLLGLKSFVKFLIAGYKNMVLFAKSIFTATKAQKGMNAAAAANPYIALISVITTLASMYFLLGEEASEAEMKIKRMNDALREDVKLTTGLGENTTAMAAAKRALANDYEYLASMIDLEMLSAKELLEVTDAVNANQDNSILIAAQQEKIFLMEEDLRLNEETRIKNADILADKIKNYEYETWIAKRLDIKSEEFSRNWGNMKRQEIADMKGKTDALIAENQKRITDTQSYLNHSLGIEGDYREVLGDFYSDELIRYRKLNRGKQLVMLEAAEDELAKVQLTLHYQDLLNNEAISTGEIQEVAAAKLKKFVTDIPKDIKPYVIDATHDFKELGVQVTVMDKYVSNLGYSLKKAAGDMREGPLSGAQLHKTKEHYKELRKLMGAVIETDFQRLNDAARQNFEINEKKYEDEIALMQTNKDRLEELSTSSDLKFLSATIKQNKNKYKVLQNISIEHFNRLTDKDKGSLEERQAMIDLMIKEETSKWQTAKDVLSDIEENFNAKMIGLANKKTLDLAKAEYDSQQAIINSEEMAGVNSFARWNRLKKARHTMEAATTAFILSEVSRRLKNTETFHTRELANIETLRVNRFAAIQQAVDEGKMTEAEAVTARENADAEAKARALQADKDFVKAKGEIYKQGEKEITEVKTTSTKADLATMNEKITAVADLYNQMFSMASSFINNRFELEMNKIAETRDLKQQDLDDGMTFELEAAEGNEDLQEAIRIKYQLRKEEADAKAEIETRKIKKKQFQMEKANNIVQAIMNAALAATKTASSSGFPALLATTPVVIGLMAAQIALIAAQKFTGAKGGITPGATSEGTLRKEKYADGGMVHGPSHANGGVKFMSGGRVVELEGGEAVINKRSTAMFGSQLSEMNVAGGGQKFAAGGVTPGTSNSVSGIANTSMALFMDKLGVEIIQGVNNKKVTMTESEVTETQSIVSITEANANIFSD